MNRVRTSNLLATLALPLLFLMPLSGLGSISAQFSSVSPQEAALQPVFREFYAAWAQKNSSRMARLWSERSPHRAARLKEVQERWSLRDFTFSQPALSQVQLGTEWSNPRVTIEMIVTDPKTKQSVRQSLVQEFALYKENGQWKMWNCPTETQDLAVFLTDAPAEHRNALLSGQEGLLSAELVKAVLEKAIQSESNRQHDVALDRFGLAQTLAEKANDQSGLIEALSGMGDVYRAQSNYQKAKETYQKALELSMVLGNHRACGDMYSLLALLSLVTGNVTAACDHYEKSLKEFETLQDSLAMADVLENLGNAHYDRGAYEPAAKAYKRCLEVRPSQEPGGLGRILANLGNCHVALNQYDQALEEYQKALTGLENRGDTPMLSQVLTSMATVHYHHRDYRLALEYYARALPLQESLADHSGAARTLESMGCVDLDQGDANSALGFFQRSLALQEKLNSVAGMAGALSNLGRGYLALQRYDSALKSFEGALQKFEVLGDKNGILAALQNVGSAHYYQTNYSEALAQYEKALKLSEEIGNKPGQANALLGIGTVKTCLGEFSQALEFFQKSLQIAEGLGDKANQATMLHNIGLVLSSQSNYSLAFHYYLKSLQLSEELQDKPAVAQTLGNLGVAHSSVGNFSQALDHHQKALALEETLGDKQGVARALGHIGGVHFMQDHLDEALTQFQRSLDKWKELNDLPGIASTLSFIGDTYFSQEDLPQALSSYQKSLEMMQALGNREASASLLAGVSSVQLALHNAQAALDSAESARVLAGEIGNDEIIWYARYLAGRALRVLGRPSEARQAYLDSIATIEQLRRRADISRQRLRFRDPKAAPYWAMFEWMSQEEKHPEAFAYLEHAKLQQLLDLLDPTRVWITKGLSQQEIELEQKAVGTLRSLNAQIYREKQLNDAVPERLHELELRLKKALPEYEAFKTNLTASHPALPLYRGQVHPAALPDVSLLLKDPRRAILEFACTKDETYLLVTAKEESRQSALASKGALPKDPLQAAVVKVFPLHIAGKQLSERVYAFREKVLSNSQDFAQAARELYDILLKPASRALAGKTRLLLVPDGVLWLLPFEALQPADDRFLVEDSSVSYAQSVSVLLETAKLNGKRNNGAAPARSLLAFAAPVPNEALNDRINALQLPDGSKMETREMEEVRALQRLYGPVASKVYAGAEAREETLRKSAGQYRLLHLAVPGVIDDLNPMYSCWLWTSSDNPEKAEDGLMEAWEIMNLDLRASLTVLSESTRPWERLRAGDGLTALSWAFLVAGCPTLVFSQWQPPLNAANPVMVGFHRNLKTAQKAPGVGASPSQSLRESVLTRLSQKEYRHPIHWANYWVMGEWR